jgi:hypothetical protein
MTDLESSPARIFTRPGDIDSVQTLAAKKLQAGRLLIEESSCFFEDVVLHFGDEIVVKHLRDNEFDLIEIIRPSAMRHYFYVIGGQFSNKEGFRPHQSMEDVLFELGGQWECDMGGLFQLHVPRCYVDTFVSRTGWALSPESEIFSGAPDINIEDSDSRAK